ncbi:MAG: Gfo/Idh/MocA family oxidoreductase [Acetomicrobium sp.]|nr:Gfo/Idh/MocA family oxidoreductase [Acetomicrobium sp.]
MNPKLGIAVVGCGRIGDTHIDAISQNSDNAYLAAVVDVIPERARSAGERYGVPFYTSLDEAMRHPEIEAVVICLPHSQHLPATAIAARAGRHVLIEKVMARNISEARKMVRVCEENGVTLMVGQSQRYFFGTQEARRRRSEIGRVLHMVYTWTTHFDKNNAPPWWRSVNETGGLIIPMVGYLAP